MGSSEFIVAVAKDNNHLPRIALPAAPIFLNRIRNLTLRTGRNLGLAVITDQLRDVRQEDDGKNDGYQPRNQRAKMMFAKVVLLHDETVDPLFN